MAKSKFSKLMSGLRPQLSGAGNTVLVARQPIFDIHGRVYAYELLFRDPHFKAGLGGKSSHGATSTVMVDGVDLMRPSLRPGQRFFINFTAELLEAEVASLLPPDVCTVEILEDVLPTDAVLTGIKNLKKTGYQIALDDYIGQKELLPFLPLVDVIKVDVLGKTEAQLRLLTGKLQHFHGQLLAEKVEDHGMASLCRSLGYAFFQGFFYSKAEVIQGKKLTPSQITKTRLLALSTNDESSIDDIATVISGDVFLAFKLLKYVQSAYFGLPTKVTDIPHAIRLIGRTRLMQWLCVIALAEMDSAPMSREIVCLSAVRAKFLETLAKKHYLRPSGEKNIPNNLFFLGLFSLVEGILGVPLQEIAHTIALDADVVAALGEDKGPLAPWKNVMLHYERGEWGDVQLLSNVLHLSDSDLTEAYTAATSWSLELFGE